MVLLRTADRGTAWRLQSSVLIIRRLIKNFGHLGALNFLQMTEFEYDVKWNHFSKCLESRTLETAEMTVHFKPLAHVRGTKTSSSSSCRVCYSHSYYILRFFFCTVSQQNCFPPWDTATCSEVTDSLLSELHPPWPLSQTQSTNVLRPSGFNGDHEWMCICLCSFRQWTAKRIPSLTKSKAETFTDILRSSRSKGSHEQKESKGQPRLCGNNYVHNSIMFKETLMISFQDSTSSKVFA